MPRIRYLQPDFFKDEDLAKLPPLVRIFYQGLWCFADKEGRGEDRLERLKVEIMPYSRIDVEEYMTLLSKPKKGSSKPYILRYRLNGQKYFQILEWKKHQKPHHTEKESIIPPPPTEEMNKLLNNGEITVKTPLLNLLKEKEKEKEKGRKIPQSDFDWIQSLKQNPAYKHIDLEVELGKMDAWLSLPQNKNRKKSRRFILNWFNRIEKTVEIKQPQKTCSRCKGKEKYINTLTGEEEKCGCQTKGTIYY